MRLWLSDAERRPDPAPVRTDPLKALVAGTALWALTLVVAVAMRDRLDELGLDWFVTAAVIGVVLGLLGISVVTLRRRRSG